MKNNKYAYLTCLLLLCFSLAHADTISAVPSNNPVNLAKVFTVDITDTGATDLAGLQFDLSWNPGILGFVNEVEGGFLATAGTTFFIPGTLDSTGGNLTFTADALIGGGPGAQGNGTLATVTFQALANGTTPLTLGNILLLDSNGDQLTYQQIDGSVTVGTPVTGVSEPSSFVLMLSSIAGVLGRQHNYKRRRIKTRLNVR